MVTSLCQRRVPIYVQQLAGLVVCIILQNIMQYIHIVLVSNESRFEDNFSSKVQTAETPPIRFRQKYRTTTNIASSRVLFAELTIVRLWASFGSMAFTYLDIHCKLQVTVGRRQGNLRTGDR
ncbi:hypothetical protein BDR06DRAFT_264252 [Suillus hirtellus]|nr:hypothetical protein BDR06DRAFT_264252 [Suillus hirtellus]